MRLLRIMSALVIVGSLAGRTTTAGAEESPRNITVVGVGREQGAPDMARVTFGVEQTAPTAQAASQAAAKSATQLLDALKKAVGDDGKVQTGGYHLSPVYRQDNPRPLPDRPHRPEIVGYTVASDITVETRKIEGVGALIDTAAAAGAARIGDVAFSLRVPAPARNRALKAAGADATSQATAIAEALQVRITKVLEASTEMSSGPILYRRSAMAMAADSVSTPMEPGDVTTEVRLRVTYGIE
jgi:uncharacterized protein YggE